MFFKLSNFVNQYNVREGNRVVNLLNKTAVRDFVEDYCGIYRFEDVTTLRAETLSNLYAATMGERRSIEDLRDTIFYSTKINVHRKHKKTSEEVYDQWTKSQSLIFHGFFNASKLFSMDTFFPGFYDLPEVKNLSKGKLITPFELFFEYTVDNLY